MLEGIIVSVAGGSLLAFIIFVFKYTAKKNAKLDDVVDGLDELKATANQLVKEAISTKVELNYQRIGIKAITKAISDNNGRDTVVNNVIREEMSEWNRLRQSEGLPTLIYKD